MDGREGVAVKEEASFKSPPLTKLDGDKLLFVFIALKNNAGFLNFHFFSYKERKASSKSEEAIGSFGFSDFISVFCDASYWAFWRRLRY